MSQTFTLPITAAEHFNHGHDRQHSRSHQRQTRLAPPFALSRIPSGSVPIDSTSHYNHEYSGSSPRGLRRELNSSHHSHTHNHSDSLSIETRAFEARNTTAAANMASQHRRVSRPTDVLLHATENYSLLHGILSDPESRRIFYFMLLNLAFMGVQSTYGFLTGSLGLISDSIHMFFDCVALLVGVCAAVMSKWPPSSKFPYGYGKIDTLAGLGNGIFLMLISVEIVYEAVERLFSGSDLQRTTELLVVSIAGLAVNMVGIFAFHGHHGHDHGHGHDHHHGENMQGIYLHIMADALGSVAVVLSTLLVQATGWSGFDPLASCIIAVLIFISTIPLVSSTIKILLLSLNSDVEYTLRDVLGGIGSIRGVVGYTVPKFWVEDIKKDPHDHHDHDHDHGHAHGHSHAHEHEHEHSHDHNHSNDFSSPVKSACSGSHSHSDSHTHDHHRDHHHDHNNGSAHAHADSNHASKSSECNSSQGPTILGTIHIQISQIADLRDVQLRVSQYFKNKNMDIIVQYEREGENKCWCSALTGVNKTPMTGGMTTPLTGSFSMPNGFVGSQILGSQGKGSPLGKML